jgi:hypothetical protein
MISDEPEALRTTPLRLAEILAAAEMVPELGGVPLEEWLSCRLSRVGHARAHVPIVQNSGCPLVRSQIWLRRLADPVLKYFWRR